MPVNAAGVCGVVTTRAMVACHFASTAPPPVAPAERLSMRRSHPLLAAGKGLLRLVPRHRATPRREAHSHERGLYRLHALFLRDRPNSVFASPSVVHRALISFVRRPARSAAVALLTVLSDGRIGTAQHVVDRSQRCTSSSASSQSAVVGDLQLPVVDRTETSSASFGAYTN